MNDPTTTTAPARTTGPPTEPGVYWLIDPTPCGGTTVIRFRRSSRGDLVGMMIGSPNTWDPREFPGYEFVGPLPEPLPGPTS